jgi:EmrB/QacA subfamily drug resistance transporter
MSSSSEQPRRAVLAVVCTALFLMPFMSSAVAVALPAIGREFGATAVQLGLVATIYVVAIAIFLLAMGRLSDIHGRRKTFLWGVAIFALTSLLICFSRSIEMLIALRFLQGTGTAMINACALAMVVGAFPASERGRVLGISVAAVYAGISVGPVLGGFLVSTLGWRAIFALGVPLGLLSYYLAATRIPPDPRQAHPEPFDWPGSAVYAAAIVAFTWGASSLTRSPLAVPAVAAGFLLGLLFVRVEMRVRYPLLDMALLTRNRVFAFSNLAAWINYAATFGVTFYFSLYLQEVKGLSPRHAGLILMVQPVIQAALSPVGGRLADRYAAGIVATVGMALCAVGLWLAAGIDAATPLSGTLAVLVFLGLGFAFFSSPNTSVIMGSVDARFLGVAAAMTGTMRTLGMTSSMVIITLTFSVLMQNQPVAPETVPAFMRSMRLDLFIFGLLCVAGVLLSLVRVRAPRETKSG